MVVRAKSHGAMLAIIGDRQADLAAFCRREIEQALSGQPEAETVLAAWDASVGPVDLRVTQFARWVKDAPLGATVRATVEGTGTRLRRRTRDVLGEWAALLTDRAALAQGFERHASGLFSPGQIDELAR